MLVNCETLLAFLADIFSPDGIISNSKVALVKVIFAPAYLALLLFLFYHLFYQLRLKIFQIPLVFVYLILIYLTIHLGLHYYLYYQPLMEIIDAGGDTILVEDSALEWATVYLSLAAVVGFFISGIIGARIAFLFALVWLFFALEEISWGQRILNLNSPEFFIKFSNQPEITLHNFFDPVLRFLYPLFFITVTLLLNLQSNLKRQYRLYSISGVEEILKLNDKYFIWLLPLSSSIISLPFFNMYEFTEQQFGLLGFLLSQILLIRLIHSQKIRKKL